jgi:predicted nucleic acid-binding protein
MIGRLLVDTNVISLITKYLLGKLKKPADIKAAKWYDEQTSSSTIFLAFATVAELRGWVISRKDQTEQIKISNQVNKIIEHCYLIQSNDEIIDSWALISHEAKIRGKLSIQNPRSSQINDIWIAATARASKLTLLTRDADFDWMGDIGVSVRKYVDTISN